MIHRNPRSSNHGDLRRSALGGVGHAGRAHGDQAGLGSRGEQAVVIDGAALADQVTALLLVPVTVA